MPTAEQHECRPQQSSRLAVKFRRDANASSTTCTNQRDGHEQMKHHDRRNVAR